MGHNEASMTKDPKKKKKVGRTAASDGLPNTGVRKPTTR